MAQTIQTYLGDGLYAEFDGWHLRLHTDSMEVFLEPAVFAALQEFAQRINVVHGRQHFAVRGL